nr:replication initiator [Micromonospora phytophila]
MPAGGRQQAGAGPARPALRAALMFLTLTLGSYGRVHSDGTPVDPDAYDYRRAAWDAVQFPRLLDRFWQNLRRAVGWNVQYAGAVEPQRRLAPHAHFAIRGTIPRALVRQVAAATYHAYSSPPAPQPAWAAASTTARAAGSRARRIRAP